MNTLRTLLIIGAVAACTALFAGPAMALGTHPSTDPADLSCVELPWDSPDNSSDAADSVDDGAFDEPVNDGVDDLDVAGTDEDESFAGTEDSDIINAAAGDDDLCGLSGDDELFGGAGVD
jgi:Ca2+-binding RTX toxin-like protein